MYKWFVLLVLLATAITPAVAGVITTEATCGDVTVQGIEWAFCGSAPENSASAGFTIGGPAFSGYVSAADVAGQSSSASTEFAGTLVFEVVDGPAQGYFQPCFNVNWNASGAEVHATAFFGPFSYGSYSFGPQDSSGALNSCSAGMGTLSYKSGVFQTFSGGLSISVASGEGDSNGFANIGLSGWKFFDLAGNSIQQPNILFGVTDVPEPSGTLLLGAGLLLCLARRNRGSRLH